jgi:hypothetical protein
MGDVQTFRDVKKMEQRSIVLYLARKGLSPLRIHDNLVTTLGADAHANADAVSYSSLTRYLRDAVFASSNPPTPLPEPEAQFDDCDHAILLALAEQPFGSVRELSRLIHLPRTTVHRRLTKSLGFRVRHLRWVPHLLSHSQKLDRVTLSQELLPMLEPQKQRSWHEVVTLDEPWFYLNTDHGLIWLQPDGKIPEREWRTIQSEKVMFTIVWNSSGFHLINVLPKTFKFNAIFYVTQILGRLSDWRRTQIGRTNRKLWVHTDNARSHTATVTLQFMQ